MNSLDLHHRQSLLVDDARGTTLRVSRGRVWITQQDDSRDIVIGPGEAWTIDRDGLTIVEAQGEATVHAIGRSARARKPVLPRALRALFAHWLSLRPRQPLPYV